MDKRRTDELAARLGRSISGEVRKSPVDRAVYSTDASNYRILPRAVVIPRDSRDVETTVSEASALGIPVTARGAGSSLAGQAVGEGVVLDLSKYMNRVIEIDAGAKKAKVEPGITIERLNGILEPYGVMFGPDPSSASVATIGGAVANNSTGAHSMLYGMAGDHVISSNAVLADGYSVELSGENYERRGRGDAAAQNLFEKLDAFRKKNAETVRNEFPKHRRRASGYSLNYLLEEKFNPAKLLASSEGTLAVSTDFEVGLVAIPAAQSLCVVSFRTVREAMEAVPEIMATSPSAIELIDATLIGLAAGKTRFQRSFPLVGDAAPGAVLAVEYQGEYQGAAEEKARSLARSLRPPHPAAAAFCGPEESGRIWETRKAGLGILMSERRRRKPVPCIEDVSVPAENLADYVGDLTSLLSEFGLSAAFYGHAIAGCLHVRPFLDLREKEDVAKMTALSERTLGLALRYSGVMSGEHGDGLQRSSLNRRLFGESVYSVMEELKDIFDPEGILNPGKVVGGGDPSRNLRAAEARADIPAMLDWSREGGLAAAAALCNGQGICRKTSGGIMCPSYRATLDERDTTRARANLLRELLQGRMGKETVLDERFHEVFDLCISCKACRSECPSGVDVAKMKTEFLALYKREKGFSPRDCVFGRVHEITSARSRLPGFLNRALFEGPLAKSVLSLAGVGAERDLPRMAEESFSIWFRRRKTDARGKEQAVYFHDTWSEFYYPGIGKAAVAVLESLGFGVIVEKRRKCCGRPMLSAGMLERARKNAAQNVGILSGYARKDIPVVFTEPSCLSAFRDEYPDILPGNESLRELLPNIHLLSEFVFARADGLRTEYSGKEEGKELFVHGHCHERAGGGFDDTVSLLSSLGYDAKPSGAGCCGMAGSFGYEKEHYGISKAIGECDLFPKIRNLEARRRVCVTGISCLEQIPHFTEAAPVHVASVLEESLCGRRPG